MLGRGLQGTGQPDCNNNSAACGRAGLLDLLPATCQGQRTAAAWWEGSSSHELEAARLCMHRMTAPAAAGGAEQGLRALLECCSMQQLLCRALLLPATNQATPSSPQHMHHNPKT